VNGRGGVPTCHSGIFSSNKFGFFGVGTVKKRESIGNFTGPSTVVKGLIRHRGKKGGLGHVCGVAGRLSERGGEPPRTRGEKS